jgi:fructose-1-phosphate kinase PfkB-like protein
VDNFLKTGITMVALSLGAEGLLLASEEDRVWACPPAVTARNPVGAGDALVAGLIWALGEGRPLHEVARWGVAAGTAAAMHAGVSVGTRGEVESLYEETTLCPWPSAEGPIRRIL